MSNIGCLEMILPHIPLVCPSLDLPNSGNNIIFLPCLYILLSQSPQIESSLYYVVSLIVLLIVFPFTPISHIPKKVQVFSVPKLFEYQPNYFPYSYFLSSLVSPIYLLQVILVRNYFILFLLWLKKQWFVFHKSHKMMKTFLSFSFIHWIRLFS